MKRGTKKPGVTMVEMTVVVAIVAIFSVSISQLLTSTRREAARGSEIIQSQVLFESIVANLRADIRRLRNVINISENTIEMEIVDRGVTNSLVYEYLPQQRVLTRNLAGAQRTFGAEGEIRHLVFEPKPDLDDITYIQMLLQVETSEPGTSPAIGKTTLSGIINFYPQSMKSVTLY